MQLSGFWQVFLGGMLGPFLMELVKITAWQSATEVAERYRKPLYWVGTAALFILGGAVAVLNGIEHVPILRAVELGIAAPAIISGYATASGPRRRRFMGDRRPGILEQIRRLLSW